MPRTVVPTPPTAGTGQSGRWLLDYLPALLRLATVLTGDPGAATRLVSSALVREASSPTGGTEFAEPRLRALVINRFLSGDRHLARDRLGRACLALRHLEGLTLAETATVVDRPVGVVAALAHDELDPMELRRSLTRLADAAPEPQTVLDALGWATRDLERARRRRARVLVLAAAVAAVLILVPTVVLPRLPGDTRTAGEWRLVHRVTAPAGWVVLDHTVSPTYEATDLRPTTGRTDASSWCRVQVFVPGGLDPETVPSPHDPVRVRGHRAFFSAGDEVSFGPVLAWSYAANAWATVSCSQADELDRTKLMLLAHAVRFRQADVSLPFRLSSVPSGYRIDSATQGLVPVSAEVILAMTENRPGDANMALTFTPLDPPADDGATQSVRINGREAFLDPSSSHPRLCIEAEQAHVCISAYWPLGDWPARAPLPVNMGPVLVRTAEQLQLAGALDDPGTWFPAREALPAG
ncbi:MAG: hypothetical protein ABWY56_08330 [Propionibacteriaceae bacterium]